MHAVWGNIHAFTRSNDHVDVQAGVCPRIDNFTMCKCMSANSIPCVHALVGDCSCRPNSRAQNVNFIPSEKLRGAPGA